MSTTLNSLPNEILHHIARLTGNDVQNLRAVNTSVHAAVECVMWEMNPIILHLNRENLELSMSMLEELSHAPLEKFRRLEIKSLDPSKEHHPPDRVWRSTDEGDFVAVPPEPKDTEQIIEARTRIPDILPEALSALTGLRSVKWFISRRDLECTRGPVLKYLGPLPHLTDFQIVSEVDTTTLPLHYLTNGSLQRLAIEQKGDPLSNHEKLTSSLATVLTHNPQLTHLKLDMATYGEGLLPFQDLFYGVPSDGVQLRSLMLCGWSIQVTPQLRPHLQSLHSVKLPLFYDADPTPLWKSLATFPPGSLPLSHITSGQVCEELLDLLESSCIQRLETLALEYADAETDEESDRFARRFYNDIFHHHRHSLRELSIIPSFTGDWPIGLHNLDLFNECKQLTRLTVGLVPDQIKPGDENDIVASFLARVAKLPNLSTVALHPVSSNTQRFARCGTGRFMAKQRVLKRMYDSIEKIIVPEVPCRPLRIILQRYIDQSAAEFTSEVVHDEDCKYGSGTSIRFRHCEE